MAKNTFKIKKEGVAYEERHPVRQFLEGTGKVIGGISVLPFAVGTAGSMGLALSNITPPTALLVAGMIGLFGISGGILMMGASHTDEEGRKHYFFHFYPNKYDKKGLIVSARNKGEASSIYLTQLLLKRGYTKSEIRDMNHLEIIDALEKRKGK